MRRIGMVGTFDVANFGDLLFPLLARNELARRLGPVEIRPYSYHARSAASWPFEVIPLEQLPGDLPSLDLLLVGGGDIIRFDGRVARNYHPSSPRIHHPTGFWLAPIFMANAANVPVAWNAPGLLGGIPRWARALVRGSIAISSYVSVRDGASRELLASLVPESQIEVVPDTAFNAATLLGETSRAPGRLPDQAFPVPSDYLVVQSRPDWRRWLQRPAAAVRPWQFVLTPVGPAVGDVVYSPRELPSQTSFCPPLDPHQMLDLIARSDGVVGTSLHLTIAALSLGRPAFRPRIAQRRKYGLLAGLAGVRNFDQRSAEGLDTALEAGTVAPDPIQLAEIRKRVERHWDTIAGLVDVNPGQQHSRKISAPLLLDVWEGLPAKLERWRTAEDLRGLTLAVMRRLANYRYSRFRG